MKQIELKKNSSQSLHQQIYKELRSQILWGDIASGEMLPSYRLMSKKLGITVTTVEKAYGLLEANGYIERRHGSGCYVLPLDSFDFYADNIVLDSFEKGQTDTREIFNFSTSTPIAGPRETATFVSIIQDLAQQRPHALFRYPPIQGAPSLIETIHSRAAQYGIRTDKRSIHIVAGSQQGIDLICKSLIHKGTVILTEDPSYLVATNCFQRSGAQIKTVAMLDDGPDIDAIEEILAQSPVDFYYTMSQFQCPTNVCWDMKKQQRLLQLAHQYGFTIIEDDCLGEINFGYEEPHPFRAMDVADSVIYLNSFSKSLVPGIRLGYMIVPAHYEKRLLMAKFNADIASPTILQETLALYIQRGLYDSYLEELRHTYVIKRACMARALAASKYLDLPYHERNGGVFFWVRLPKQIDSMELWNRLRSRNIKLLPSTVFSKTGRLKNYIRLSYVGLTLEQIEYGIACIDGEVELLLMNRRNVY